MLLALTALSSGKAVAGYILTDIADNGSGAFNGGQFFGTPVVVEGSPDIAFAAQSAQRTTGIFVGGGSPLTQVSTDANAPNQTLIEVNANRTALGVTFGGSLFTTSVAAPNQPVTILPSYLNRGSNAAIDNQNNVVYVTNTGGQLPAGTVPEISGQVPGGPRVTVVDGGTGTAVIAIPGTGFTDPKIAEKGSQSFGPSMVFGTNQIVLIAPGSSLQSVDNPLSAPDQFQNNKGIAVQLGGTAFLNPQQLPPTTYLGDVNSSGQVVFRTFMPSVSDSSTGTVAVGTAQDWNVPPSQGSLLPTRTVYSAASTTGGFGAIAPAVSIAKNDNDYAFSDGNSIYASYVGGGKPNKVVSIGDQVNGKTIASIQVAERNFINDNGVIVFKAGFTDGTSAILEAAPKPWRYASFNAFNQAATCRACLIQVHGADPGTGTGTDPLFFTLGQRGQGVTVKAPAGLFFTGLVIPDLTDDHHGLVPQHMLLHIGNLTFDLGSNETADFTHLLPGVFNNGFANGFPGITQFTLDSFSGFPDDTLPLGLLFSADPNGGTIEADTVSEPASLVLFAVALAGLGVTRHRQPLEKTHF